MIAEATRYEELLRVLGVGAFGKVEYESESKVLLRTAEVKTADLSGTVRIYFNNKREQVVSGRRFDPMGSGLLLLRPGAFYRVYTTIEIAEPLPKGVSALVALNDAAADVMMITTAPFREGYIGPVMFTIQPFRKVEIEKMTSIASLMFFEEPSIGDNDWKSSVVKLIHTEVKKALKNGNSDRTKKSSAPAKRKPTTKKKVEVKDADSVPDEYPDNPES